MASAPSVRHDRPFALRPARAGPRGRPGAARRPGRLRVRRPLPVRRRRLRGAAAARAGRRPVERRLPPPRGVASHLAGGSPLTRCHEAERTASMPVEFIGMIGTQGPVGDPAARRGPVDRPRLRPAVRPRARGRRLRPGPDRLRLVPAGRHRRSPPTPPPTPSALGFLVAHRPGFVAPTLAARTFATLDQFTGGRIAVHIITGGSDAEQRRDGDYLAKDERYARTDEYLDIARSRPGPPTAPFDYEGRVLPARGLLRRGPVRRSSRASRSTSAARRTRPTGSAASTPTSTRCGASRWPRPREQIASVTAAAARGRPDRAAADQRLVPADPRADRGAGLGAGAPASWRPPRRNVGGVPAPVALADRCSAAPSPQNVGSQRLLAAAAQGRAARPGAVDAAGRRRPARRATRPRWSARRRRSPRRCSTTSTSA